MKWNAPPKEASVEDAVCEYARKKGWRPRKLKTPGNRGAVDRYFTKAPARIIFIEFKRRNEAPREDQLLEIDALRSEGFEVYVVDTKEQGFAIFDNAD